MQKKSKALTSKTMPNATCVPNQSRIKVLVLSWISILNPIPMTPNLFMMTALFVSDAKFQLAPEFTTFKIEVLIAPNATRTDLIPVSFVKNPWMGDTTPKMKRGCVLVVTTKSSILVKNVRKF